MFNLTVILGAGAAVDVVTPLSHEVYDAEYRPPITADLFFTPRKWENEYNNYPNVSSVISELRNKYPNKHGRTSVNIEDFLGSLKNSTKPHRRAQFREFPLYLQRYFTAVTDYYCLRPSNYMTLLNRIFDTDVERVVFVTTNYDLLFEKALYSHNSTRFDISNPDMNKYVSNGKWAYIKLHGSIDWGRRIKDNMVKNRGNTLPALLDNVAQLGDQLDTALENEIIRDGGYNQKERELIYPAISVPVGQSKLNCPDNHVKVLKEHLNQCQDFLVIGFSGYDKDILQLLDEKENGFRRIVFISGSKEGARKTMMNFFSFGNLHGKLQSNASPYEGNGFDEFIRSINNKSSLLY